MSWAAFAEVLVVELFYRLLRSFLVSPQRNGSTALPDGGARSSAEDESMSLLDYFDTQRPAVKRIKRSDSDINESLSRETSGSDENLVSGSRKSSGISSSEDSDKDTPAPDEVSDPLDISPNEDPLIPAGSQTELEVSLPQIKTDQEAIEEYEASKAAEALDSENEQEFGLQERIDKRKWRRGRSSIYVDAFNLALETVLDEESHLFSGSEKEVFDQWAKLPYESQYLYVRLFLRKTAAWHRINKLGYYQDIADLPGAIIDLRTPRTLPQSSAAVSNNPAELALPEEIILGETFRFAEGVEEITTLEEASKLLLLEELKSLAKDAKVQGKNKKELLAALRQTSQTQTGIGWNGGSEDVDNPNGNREIYYIRKILDNVGDCIRLTSAPLKLFERVHLVFYRSTEWTEKSLTTIILAKISRKNFPEYIVSRSSSIFPSRADLLEFEAALRTQFEIDNILEFSGTPTKEKLQEIKEIGEKILPRWRTLVEQEQRKEDSIYYNGEGAYLRRFSPAWVYTRIIHKSTYPLGRFKEHKKEHEILTELLDQNLFHTARRGAWYQRKALLEEHYMWALTPSDGRADDAQKRHWKKIALQTCETGLRDPGCHVIYHYDLQKRIMKLEKSLKVVKREQHDFGHSLLAQPYERTVQGIKVEREESPVKNGPSTNGDQPSRRGRPTVWIDEREGGGECRVESMCLSWYRDQGWKGFHCESGIVRTLFGYLFHDVLYTYVPNVFQTPFQTCPLDLHTDAFYPSRASEINHRLVQIANGEAERIIRALHERESDKQTCIVGIDWTFELDDLIEIAQCFRGEALATVCKVMAQEYQQRGGGIPDLFLWHIGKKEVMFSEVKSENDRLSDTQRLWIHVLMGAGIRVELCNAVAREIRTE